MDWTLDLDQDLNLDWTWSLTIYTFVVVKSVTKPNLYENRVESNVITSRQTYKCILRYFILKQKLTGGSYYFTDTFGLLYILYSSYDVKGRNVNIYILLISDKINNATWKSIESTDSSIKKREK